MITIYLRDFTNEHEAWIAKNIGPRMHWLHNSRGGQGWIAKRNGRVWTITFEDDRYATLFGLMFSEVIA
jgi:hypothetical protein